MRVPLRVRAALAGAVLFTLALLTVRQISYWENSLDLWAHTLRVTENNLVAEDNLGVALLAVGDAQAALPHFQNAARINPLDPLSHINIGADFQEHARWADAVAEYTTALRLTADPRLLTVTYKNLGGVYRRMGDFSNAENSYEQVVKIDPRDESAFLALGVLRREHLIHDLTLSLGEHPRADGYLQLGQLLQQAGRASEARDAYQRSVVLGDPSGEARKALAGLDVNAGRY
ncbi:MAG: tetratricopeptide repeat protein [Terriglobales bacterium]